mgnify:CR=1 FL=1
MHAYTKAMTSTTRTPTQTTLTRKDRTMNPHRHPLIRTLLTGTAYFLGLLLLTALWTVYGPSYDTQAAPLPTDATSTQAAPSEPCPAGEATGGTCGTEGAINPPSDASTDSPSPSDTPQAPTQRRCKGCRLSQEEHDARQADKQAAHDRAEARKQRGAERRAEAERKREERAARKSSKSSPAKSSSRSSSHTSHTTNSNDTPSQASESSSEGLPTQDGTTTQADPPQTPQDASEVSSDSANDTPAASAPYTPLEIPEASHRPAPYDASKDPFEVRREAARQAADAVNSSAAHSTSPDQVKAPAPTSTSSTGYWAEQMPTWALALIGFLAAAGIFTYKVSRPRSYGDRRS